MGRVFTPEQVANHEVPEPGAHELAGRTILKSLFEPEGLYTPNYDHSQHSSLLETEKTAVPDSWTLNTEIYTRYFGLEAGMVYGSTALGCANIRSDLDILITYHQVASSTTMDIISEVFQAAEEEYRVLVEGNILNVSALFSPLEHSIDPLFARHLIDIQNQEEPRWSYNWPVDGLTSGGVDLHPDQEQVRALAIRYCSGKTRYLTHKRTEYRGAIDYQALRRALEIPAALGRKVLAATLGVEQVDQDLLQNKNRIIGLLGEVLAKATEAAGYSLGEPELQMKRLAAADREYTELLNSALNGETSTESYRGWLDRRYIELLHLGHDVSAAWTEIMRTGLDKRNGQQPSDTMPELDRDGY